MKIFQIRYNPKLTSFLIIGICIMGIIIGNYVERFRISNLRWIYEYGKLINFIMVFGSLGWSFLHPLIIWSNNKPQWKKQLIWMIVGLIPVLYIITMFIVSEIRYSDL